MKATRTELIYLKPDNNISKLCHLSKNLYNEADYIIRRTFFEIGKWVRYNEIAGVLKNSENYKALPSQTAQQTIRILDRDWKSFFKAIKNWKKNQDKFLGRPKPPGYKKKNGAFLLIFTNQQCKIRNGEIRFPKKVGLRIRTRLDDKTDLREIRIVPRGVGYILEIVYKKIIKTLRLAKNRIVGIDLGFRNIVTIVNNIGEKPIVVKGGVVKSINQYYNKEKAILESVYDKQGIKTGTRLKKLTEKRNRKIYDTFHKLSRRIVKWCIQHNIGTIVIGHNTNWKQNSNLGKRNNQNFAQIPFDKLLKQLKYKAEEVGIKVIEQNEKHTSKCSFLDNETIEHQNNYAGKRISRGLFRSAKGIIINADVNGAYNIIRKAFPKAFADGIEGVGLHPVRIDL